MAAAETSYGQGWVGSQSACKGSNNWGARQLTKGEIEKGSPGCWGTDSHPNNERYPQQFKVYPSPVEGARDVVRLLTRQRSRTWAVIRDEKASIYDFSEMLRRDRYYGGLCPEATKQFGEKVKRYGDPTDDATTACHLEAAKHHAEKFIGPLISQIAGAIGVEPPPMYRPEASGEGGAVALVEGAPSSVAIRLGAGLAVLGVLGWALWKGWRA